MFQTDRSDMPGLVSIAQRLKTMFRLGIAPASHAASIENCWAGRNDTLGIDANASE